MYLLDTIIVSELRKRKPHGGVVAWLEGVANDQIYISAVTLGELQAGIELTRRQDSARAREIAVRSRRPAPNTRIAPVSSTVAGMSSVWRSRRKSFVRPPCVRTRRT